MASMKGRFCVVTGASTPHGIGNTIAKRFAEAGASVFLVAEGTREQLETAQAECRAFPVAGNAEAMIADAHKRFGRIDVLVNNAGIRAPIDFGDYTRAQFDAVVGVNIATPFFASQAVVPIMRAQGGGRIIHIASQLGHVTYAKRALYGLTKAALLHLTKSMAYELGKDNIQVNSVSPGPIKTQPLIDRLRTEPEEMARRISQYVPLGRLGEPGEIADVAFFLATDAPAFLQGEDICVDGGYINH
ncbi:MAG: SDR family oxidoreductase [Burkholderiales bacterium]|nr:SDR family oxidoreductase [Burkholderiales bacterium]